MISFIVFAILVFCLFSISSSEKFVNNIHNTMSATHKMSATPRPPTKAELKAAARAADKAAQRDSNIEMVHQRNADLQESRAAKLRAAMELERQKVAAQEAAEQAAIQERGHRAHLRRQANAAALAKYTAEYTKAAHQILTLLALTLNTRILETIGEHCLVAPIKATLRALCLGLTRLRLQNSKDKSTEIPFTRVDPAVIEEPFPTFKMGEFLQDKDVPDAVLITILVDTSNHYILATPNGKNVRFEHLPNGELVRDAMERYPNILHIGNGEPYKSPDELDALQEMLANCSRE